jgi:Leucine-rich repeat (LRR) protein
MNFEGFAILSWFLLLSLLWCRFPDTFSALLASPNLSNEEFNALHEFYDELHGEYWIYTPSSISVPWNFSTADPNPCSEPLWQGVICSCAVEVCTVIELVLDKHNLTGTIPSSFETFFNLEFIDLSTNFIRGTFPDVLTKMEQLSFISLGDNGLIGSVPSSLCCLNELKEVNFGYNFLTGLPTEIFNNSVIESLSLESNDFTMNLPDSIGNMRSLKRLIIGKNGFRSTIPVTIGNLKNLTDLDLSTNKLNGTMPDSIWQLSSLRRLLLEYNHITGTISSNISNLLHLELLSIAENSFFGSIPYEIGYLTDLIYLNIEVNLFSQSLPSSFSNLKSITEFLTADNSFTGNVNFLVILKNCIVYYLFENFFSGNITNLIPIDHIPEVFEVTVRNNLFSGPLVSFPPDTYIYMFEGNVNYFDSTLPALNSSFNRLYYYNVGNNYLTGSIPSTFFTYSNLSVFNVSFNLLTGVLPYTVFEEKESFSGSKISQLYLNNNHLMGTLHGVFVGILPKLIVLSLSNNGFTGTIPNTLKNCHFLEQVFVENNKFTGSMTELLGNTFLNGASFTNSTLINIDLSNNEFTGSLPSNFFESAQVLESLAIVSNCLSGSIPGEICKIKTLNSLALDGLSSSQNCQILIFPGLSSSFVFKNVITGGIPSCLYSLPYLETLHLSGNGLTGTLPSNLNFSHTLNDLSLSHNSFSGIIPVNLQSRSWTNLDLSYNKLSGYLSDSFVTIPPDGELLLDVNRLSGVIPTSLLNILNISILNGNIFSCESEGGGLPRHDSDYNSYTCGSTTVDAIVYSWVAFALVLFLFLIAVRYFSMNSVAVNSLNCTEKGIQMFSLVKESFCGAEDYFQNFPNTNIGKSIKFFHDLRKFFFFLGVCSMMILLPTFSVLTYFTHSYSNEYIWNVSAVLLSGQTAAIVLMIVFFVVVVSVYFQLQSILNSSATTVVSDEIQHRGSSADPRTFSTPLALTYCLVLLADIVVMSFGDIFYVIVVVNYSETITTIAAIVLAMFRMLSNNFLLLMLPKLKSFLVGENVDRGTEISRVSESRDISFVEILTLLNNVLIPVFAVLIILPDCFYNTFVSPESVSSSYKFISCGEYFRNGTLGLLCDEDVVETSYTPPFIYSYQCSSKIIINYVPVYLILFLFSGLVVPLKNVLLKSWYDRYVQNLKMNPDQQSSWLFQCLNFLIPDSLKALDFSQDNASTHPPDDYVFFSKTRFTVHLTSYFAIILGFGGIFPPLSVIGCCTIIIQTYQEEVFMGIVIVKGSMHQRIISQLERQCEDLLTSLHVSLSAGLFISCCLYAYIVFDAWGDAVGWKTAMVGLCLVAFYPFVVSLTYHGAKYFIEGRDVIVDKTNPTLSGENDAVTDEESDGYRNIQMSRTSSVAKAGQPVVLNPLQYLE